jgi:hypothetical protein
MKKQMLNDDAMSWIHSETPLGVSPAPFPVKHYDGCKIDWLITEIEGENE